MSSLVFRCALNINVTLSCLSDDEDCIENEDVSAMDEIERLECNFDSIAAEDNNEGTNEFRNTFFVSGRATPPHGSFCIKRVEASELSILQGHLVRRSWFRARELGIHCSFWESFFFKCVLRRTQSKMLRNLYPKSFLDMHSFLHI